MIKTAVISECGHYRYELRRIWDKEKPLVLFVCLNPSTADHEQEDNTSRVSINYAKRWGYGGLIIANLFAYRSKNQTALFEIDDPVGPENNFYLRKLNKEATMVICAWSDTGGYKNRDQEVLQLLKKPHCLTKLRSGRPGHPLYKKKTLIPIPL